MLVRNLSTTVEIPHEPGNSVTIRRLGRAQRRQAADARTAAAVKKVQTLGGAAVVKDMQQMAEKVVGPDGEPKVDSNPADAFDHDTLIRFGLTGIEGPNYQGVSVTPETIDDLLDQLDDVTAEWLANEIARFTFEGGKAKND